MNENAASMNQNENHTMYAVEQGGDSIWTLLRILHDTHREFIFHFCFLTSSKGVDMCMKAELQNIMESRKQQVFCVI